MYIFSENIKIFTFCTKMKKYALFPEIVKIFCIYIFKLVRNNEFIQVGWMDIYNSRAHRKTCRSYNCRVLVTYYNDVSY